MSTTLRAWLGWAVVVGSIFMAGYNLAGGDTYAAGLCLIIAVYRAEIVSLERGR